MLLRTAIFPVLLAGAITLVASQNIQAGQCQGTTYAFGSNGQGNAKCYCNTYFQAPGSAPPSQCNTGASNYLGCFTDLSYFNNRKWLPGFGGPDNGNPCQYCKVNFLPGDGGFSLDGQSAVCHCPLSGGPDAVDFNSCSCKSGYFKSGNACLKTCAGNQYNRFGQCLSCPSGTYSTGATTSCSSCGIGTPFAIPGFCVCPALSLQPFAVDEPCSCLPGTVYDVSLDVCRQCDSGQVYDPKRQLCISCTPSTYTYDPVQQKCYLCPDGLRYNSATGNCDCQAGYYMSNGQCVKCVGTLSQDQATCTCPPGTAYDGSACTQCSAGRYSPGGDQAASTCSSCAGGSTDAARSACSCSAGAFLSSSTKSCTRCDNYSFSTAGSSACIACGDGRPVNSRDTCNCDINASKQADGSCKCPSGTTSGYIGSDRACVCNDRSTIFDPASAECKPCTGGTVQNGRCTCPNSSVPTSTGCEPCPANTFYSIATNTCRPCGAGISSAGSSTCTCASGAIQSYAYPALCTCPAGYIYKSDVQACVLAASPGARKVKRGVPHHGVQGVLASRHCQATESLCTISAGTTECVDLSNDIAHCGSCNLDCDKLPGVASSTCSHGHCHITSCSTGNRLAADKQSCIKSATGRRL